METAEGVFVKIIMMPLCLAMCGLFCCMGVMVFKEYGLKGNGWDDKLFGYGFGTGTFIAGIIGAGMTIAIMACGVGKDW